MASIITQEASVVGGALTLSAASAGGDTVDTGRDHVLIVRNASAAPVTVTVETPGTVEGLAISDNPVSVAAGGFALVQLDGSTYGRPSNLSDAGRAHVTYSATASVTIAVVRC